MRGAVKLFRIVLKSGNKAPADNLSQGSFSGADISGKNNRMIDHAQVAENEERRFLYPASRQFPFDEVCGQIVTELEKRNFQIPGIKVKFDYYGSGDQKVKMVGLIEGDDFRMHFGRPQGKLPGGEWNDIAAISTINIPGWELAVYNDESGPTLYMYVGKNWWADKERFTNGAKVNSKLNEEPRTYLLYKGSCSGGKGKSLAYNYGRRMPFLLHSNDLGREYERRTEPVSFKTSEIFQLLRGYLLHAVLPRITRYPIPARKIVPEKANIPFPESIGKLFVAGNWRDKERIGKGKEDPLLLREWERYGLKADGYRVVPLDVPNDGSMPDIAYEGFLWCSIWQQGRMITPDHYQLGKYGQDVPICIRPKSAIGIFIADLADQERYRNKIFAATPGQSRLTKEQYYEFCRILGRSIVPVTEYDGSYEEPVALVCRELGLDEVEIVE